MVLNMINDIRYKQLNVQRGALHALFIIVVIAALLLSLDLGTYYLELSFIERAQHLAIAEVFMVLTLVVAVIRVANFRFKSTEDIDGSGLTIPSQDIRILVAILQNTLEQFCIAIVVHVLWILLMPADFLPYCFGAILCFVSGRILFNLGYAKGSSGRALGFGLTMYPSILMLVSLVVFILMTL